jgi:hypothetical protein
VSLISIGVNVTDDASPTGVGGGWLRGWGVGFISRIPFKSDISVAPSVFIVTIFESTSKTVAIEL